MRHAKLLTGLAALALALVPNAAGAKGQLQCDVSTFVNAGTELNVCVFVNPRSDGTEERILLLGIRSSDNHRISIAFDPSETPAVLRLWRQALDKQSTSWQPVGDLSEKNTDDHSRLSVSAGPGVRMAIQSPARGSYTSEIPPADLPRFTTALEKAANFVAGSR
jgi:hypothetical protein